MDKDRQIRMLIPPFFMFASVLWEAFLSHDLQQYLQNASVGSEYAYVKTVLSLLGIVGVATLPLGYVIGLLTISVLRLPLIRRCFPHENYEIPISKVAMEKIWRLLGHAQYEKWTLCAAAAFDHLLVQPKLHEWLFRRWSSFLISTQCVTALVVSYGLGLALGLHPTLMWWITIGTLSLAFVSNSIISWREMYKMFDFAVDVKAVRRQSAAHPHAIAPKTGIDVTARTA